jgi:NAD(P)-dependent dehydrogenase (short-subunit alcohol dehydrogenase family)
VNYYSDKEHGAAQEVADLVEQAGRGKAIAVQADVGNQDDVARSVTEAVNAFGGLDLLVNNAGIKKQVPLLETPREGWEQILRTLSVRARRTSSCAASKASTVRQKWSFASPPGPNTA